eukprot:scaffold16998_cov77-Skeletonema_dohrnii-CCMP3373.AAC.1
MRSDYERIIWIDAASTSGTISSRHRARMTTAAQCMKGWYVPVPVCLCEIHQDTYRVWGRRVQ